MKQTVYLLLILSFMFIGGPSSAQDNDPYAAIDVNRIISTLEELTSIQEWSGWRNSASSGEAEALDYMQANVESLTNLTEMGIEIERQEFTVMVATEIWQSDLHITVDGETYQVAADSPRGSAQDPFSALRMDTDGQLNDSDNNPTELTASIVIVRTEDDLRNLNNVDLLDKIVFLDQTLVDVFVLGELSRLNAFNLVEKHPAGIVIVTEYSDEPGESHGAGSGDMNRVAEAESDHIPLVMYAPLEEMAVAGISSWEDLNRIDEARMVLDVDVFAPGKGGNLIVTIPGRDRSRAYIMGGHIDTPNSPGALDNGSGSAMLLEVLHVLDETQTQPPIDLVVAWFGSEEIGLYGSHYFTMTHQELLDRAVMMSTVDCLGDPLNGVNAHIDATSWYFVGYPGNTVPWLDYVQNIAAEQNISINTTPSGETIGSDNSAANSFNVPNFNLGYWDYQSALAVGGVHYASNLHSPYDNMDRIEGNEDILRQMTTVALATVLNVNAETELRLTPVPDKRAVFVASHTESTHTSVNTMNNLSMTLAMFGYDVDVIPYGQAVTSDGLADAELVVVLPVIDYALDDSVTDETWDEDEIEAVLEYVENDGLLVVANTWRWFGQFSIDTGPHNEDWDALNPLTENFGVTFNDEVIVGDFGPLTETPLLDNVDSLIYGTNSAVNFTYDQRGVPMIGAGSDQPLLAGIDMGDEGGLVLIVGDFGLLRERGEAGSPTNLRFWFNLARFSSQYASNLNE